MRVRLACAIAAGAAIAGGSTLALAARAGAVSHPFQIAAGPAAVTIPALARQAGVRVLADGDDLTGIATGPLQGEFGTAQALDRLLAGTGLAARFNANGTVLIVKKPAATPLPMPVPVQDAAAGAAPAQVRITGMRIAQQTSIGRKKNAATALDAVVAEDVGTFPDRNAAEAISRLAGVTLERGDYGEGSTVNVRGNAADFTRVEIDGLGAQAGGGTDLNNGGGGRGVDLRELSTDLIRSIDVVKGATADMTEGSLGGSIVIRTRTGLDFDRRYLSLRLAGQGNSINRKVAPNLNLVFADRLLDGRLGVLFNLSGSEAHNENHTMTVSNRSTGLSRLIDFDQSPEKTFSFDPVLVSRTDPAATLPLQRWAKMGGGTFDSLSPLDIVARSGAAATKDACHAAFPAYQPAELATIASVAGRAAAQNQRANELLGCLHQWSDYTPQNLRYQMRRQDDRRLSGDLRIDFKVDARLSVYGRLNRNRREIDDHQLYLSPGILSINTAGRYTDSPGPAAGTVVRTALPGSGYRAYATPANLGIVDGVWQGLSDGSVVNVDPAAVTVDATHHVTGYTLAQTLVNADQIYERIGSASRYSQVGGAWRDGGLQVDFLAGLVDADASRMQWRTNLNQPIGATTVVLSPDGWWLAGVPAGVAAAQADPARYGVLATPADARLPATSAVTQLSLANPRIMERRESTLKLDLRYALDGRIPFLTRLKFGANRRGYRADSWTGQGYVAQAAAAGRDAVVVPRAALGSSFQACEDTAGSLAPGGAPCRYGVAPGSNPAFALNSAIVMTQDAYRAIVAQALTPQSVRFFDSLPGRPAGMLDSWPGIDVRQVIAATGVANFNYDCVKSCRASDGKVYEQPKTGVGERTTAGYLGTEFMVDRLPWREQPLPNGWEIDGNLGWRVVRTDVAATGLVTQQSIAGGAAAGALARNTTLHGSATDVMPMLNLAWWVAPERFVVRYNQAKAIARPSVEYLYSSGVTCSYQAGLPPDVDMACDGTMGNPDLRPMTNRNYNLSAEWYPDRDTVLSLAAFRQRGVIGAPIRVAVAGAEPFGGSGAVDPATGTDLSDVRYAYATWVNGPAVRRNGIEAGLKTAFTRLPSLLRHTGVDASYTRVRSGNVAGAVRDLVTGAALAPSNEMKYSWNASLWYDDGALRARVAMQSAAAFFRGLATLANNFPATGTSGGTVLPFSPGSATFRDANRFIDAKVSYRFASGFEVFAEGRNLGRAAVTNSQTAMQPYADGTPNLLDRAYYGAQFLFGVTLRH